mmetsp:Transcript_29465/g.41402  ORF Transcript_29465/g.41402 Transcript_29465/m.41402 type:complete len:101 (-) Transcript_29465:954-1256(-)
MSKSCPSISSSKCLENATQLCFQVQRRRRIVDGQPLHAQCHMPYVAIWGVWRTDAMSNVPFKIVWIRFTQDHLSCVMQQRGDVGAKIAFDVSAVKSKIFQ